MKMALTDAAARRGLYDGLVLGVIAMVLVFVSNVLLPPDFQNSPAKQVAAWVLLILCAVAFVVIGGRGQRRANIPSAGAKAGAVAGFVVAVLFLATLLIMDNLFFATISQLPYKAGSTRASLTVTVGFAAVFFLPVTSCVGAVLGALGGSLVDDRLARFGTERPTGTVGQ